MDNSLDDLYESKTKIWFRWIIFLPCAFTAAVLSSFPLHWILYMSLSHIVEPYPDSLERFLTPFMASLLFVWVGSYVAPKYKLKTAISLCVVWILLLVCLMTFAINSHLRINQLFVQNTGFNPILSFIGALVGVLIAKMSSE